MVDEGEARINYYLTHAPRRSCGGGRHVFGGIRLNLVIRMYNYILPIPKILNTSSLPRIGYKWTFALSDKILKKVEIGKNITIA